jgi:hypothetical protein
MVTKNIFEFLGIGASGFFPNRELVRSGIGDPTWAAFSRSNRFP